MPQIYCMGPTNLRYTLINGVKQREGSSRDYPIRHLIETGPVALKLVTQHPQLSMGHNRHTWGRSSIPRLHGHTHTHHTRYDSSGRLMIAPTQRPVPDNTCKRQTNMPLEGFEPGIFSKRAAANPRHRPRDHRDWRCGIAIRSSVV
jgi:hypothetical protein